MKEKGRDFNDVLKEAQALGYAEEDPTFDIEGIDAATNSLYWLQLPLELKFNLIKSTQRVSVIFQPKIFSMQQSSAIQLNTLGLQKS